MPSRKKINPAAAQILLERFDESHLYNLCLKSGICPQCASEKLITKTYGKYLQYSDYVCGHCGLNSKEVFIPGLMGLRKRYEDEPAKKVMEKSPEVDNLEIKADIRKGVPAFKLLVLANLCQSNSQARNLIKQGGAYVDGKAIAKFDQMIKSDTPILLRKGKKSYKRIVPSK